MSVGLWAACGHVRTPETTINISASRLGGQCRLCVIRYRQSEKGRISHNARVARYRQTEKGRISHQIRADRYNVTAKGIFSRAYGKLAERRREHAIRLTELEELLNG